VNIGELLVAGLQTILSWQTVLIMLVGVLVGVFCGALPGFSAANTCAICLPLTITMGTVNGLAFMGAVYVGSNCGGGIPAVLFNLPGTPSSSATSFDGYPLSKQGKADVALGAVITASAIGTLISSIFAALTIVPMAKLALKFGPAEMFMLVLMGVVIIVNVVGDDPIKGLLSALIGFMIAAMPADPYLGTPRMNFGFLELYDSIPLVPTLIGLFAIPSLLNLSKMNYIVEIPLEEAKGIGKVRNILKGALETVKRPHKLAISTIIGSVIGAIPGTGANIAAFVSYGTAVSMSKEPETFGKGNIEGVIACESANNACVGGAMIPAFSLGIPGSATTAIMLSMLLLHGIVPGPDVVRDHGPMVYGFLIILFVGGLLIVPFGIWFAKIFSKLTVVRSCILVAPLMALCLVGAFAERTFLFDMYLLIVFGLVGLLIEKSKFPVVPLVLGLVLGGAVERNFLQAISLSRGSYAIFFQSPICKILWAINIAVLIVPRVIKLVRKRKDAKKAA